VVGERRGRKRPGLRSSVRHARRPGTKSVIRCVTLRAVGEAAELAQANRASPEARRSRTARAWFRVVHFSVRADHVHLLRGKPATRSPCRVGPRLAIRVARAVNRRLGRSGKVCGSFTTRALRTPREVRHGIVYVLANWHKHVPDARGLDGCSSAWWLDGWSTPRHAWATGRRSSQPSAKLTRPFLQPPECLARANGLETKWPASRQQRQRASPRPRGAAPRAAQAPPARRATRPPRATRTCLVRRR
jgi:hypothetical protein